MTSAGQEEVSVTELMPQVPALTRFGVGSIERHGRGASMSQDRMNHRQVRGPRFVKSGEQTIDRTHFGASVDHEIGPS